MALASPPSLLDVLAIAPHPDDVEICCGGTIATLSRKGQRTGILDLTAGELGTNGSVELRAQETARASEFLGLTLRENLNLPDGAIDGNCRDKSADSQLVKLVDCLRRLRPKILIVPYWQARHPDHVAASELSTNAVFYAGLRRFPDGTDIEPYRPLQVLYYQMRYAFRPSFIVDTSVGATAKIESIRAYSSQISLIPIAEASAETNAPTLLNSSLTLHAIEARDRYYGAMIGATHGEPFLMKNALRLDDPLHFFAQSAQHSALYYPEVN